MEKQMHWDIRSILEEIPESDPTMIGSFVSPADKKTGISFFIGNNEQQSSVLRIYIMRRDQLKRFVPLYNVAAYSFSTHIEAVNFATKIPSMSAIELMQYINMFGHNKATTLS
ncbi:hypothetical protein [Pontibacillus salipaludis]|uniref:Uncharacterized protein n=1 Tax=Pontibacillus salipaludis TaxID=1697394 RepID=A0ABQ1QIL0_9BACI|nr:hypothetical protein [Pontibacillus salipaludis]GGD29002.1 hypothetical protein GCM10011389_40740 [Pontibacillus salipaludis]